MEICVPQHSILHWMGSRLAQKYLMRFLAELRQQLSFYYLEQKLLPSLELLGRLGRPKFCDIVLTANVSPWNGTILEVAY